jgi:GH15 family glucan-1,4-alpha-glucosidase
MRLVNAHPNGGMPLASGMAMAYQPIQNYGLIGNMRTAALVSNQGSVDWYCSPKFDSPSVFAKILDEKKGGYFEIKPLGERISEKQFYWPDTNILVTRFLAKGGIVEIVDFMPTSGQEAERHQIVRHVRCVRGRVRLRLACHPAFDYGRANHVVEVAKDRAEFTSPRLRLALATELPLKKMNNGIEADFELSEGESSTLALRTLRNTQECGPSISAEEGDQLFFETMRFWRTWLSKCTYQGRWREVVQRSALVLKLLTYEPTGAIVAAPTCSLPEAIGGVRNWDYRYTWLRDSAFTIYALMRVGFVDEAGAFMGFLRKRIGDCGSRSDGPLQIVYGIEGESELIESELPNLDGYKGSRPVRIGNAAYKQLQLDIYGEILDSVYLYNKYGALLPYEGWTGIQAIMEWLIQNWRRPDAGIWEVRSGRKGFTHSKLMCWVAFDRALRLAEKRSFPAKRVEWAKVRDEIYLEIMTRGWSERRQSFTQAFDDEQLDAANLLMPLVFFLAPDDTRMLSTLNEIIKTPSNGGLVTDGLVYRYDLERSKDGLTGREGTFNICSFWLIEALSRAGKTDKGKLELARTFFERMLGYGNHLGLYAEQTSGTGEALGNYPQALTHLALISTAFNLDRVLSGKRQPLSH